MSNPYSTPQSNLASILIEGFIGGLIGLTNILFIFHGDKRYLHDLIANTQVINFRG
jgi:uncharacterized RDD family membrane protein YckC